MLESSPEIDVKKAQASWDDFVAKAGAKGETVGKRFSDALDLAANSLQTINKISGQFSDAMEALPGTMGKVGKAVGDTVGGLTEAATQAKDWATAGAALGSVIPGVGTAVGGMVGGMASIASSAWDWYNATDETGKKLKEIYDEEKKRRDGPPRELTQDEKNWQKIVEDHEKKVTKAAEADMTFSRQVDGVGEAQVKAEPKIKKTTEAIEDQTAAIEAQTRAMLERLTMNSETTLDSDSGRTQEDIDETTKKLQEQFAELERIENILRNDIPEAYRKASEAIEIFKVAEKDATDVLIEQVLAIENFLLGSATNAINTFYDNWANREQLSSEDRKRRRAEWLRDMGSFLMDDGAKHVLAGTAKLVAGGPDALNGGTEIGMGLVEISAGAAVGGVGAIAQRRLGGTEGRDSGTPSTGSAGGFSGSNDQSTRDLRPIVINYNSVVPPTEREAQNAANKVSNLLRRRRG